jgi:hypothetical protein
MMFTEPSRIEVVGLWRRAWDSIEHRISRRRTVPDAKNMLSSLCCRDERVLAPPLVITIHTGSKQT